VREWRAIEGVRADARNLFDDDRSGVPRLGILFERNLPMTKKQALLKLERTYDHLSKLAKRLVHKMATQPRDQVRRQLQRKLRTLDMHRSALYRQMDEVWRLEDTKR
jgi:hypothetical protein